MERRDLERWLCGVDAPVLAPASIARILGVPWESVQDTTLIRVADRLRSLRFTLLVLRDVFAEDRDVRAWLSAPAAELGGQRPLDALFAGRLSAVEELAVAEWRRSTQGAGVGDAAAGGAPGAAAPQPAAAR
jgi:hypothetical protein